jgi:hypothetical protein
MSRSNILVRLSGRRNEQRPSPDTEVKHTAENTSRRRKPLASLGRRLNSVLKLKPPSPTSAAQASFPENDDTAELPNPYPRPVEVIREEEYPHMNQG